MTQHVNLYDASLRITRDWLGPESFASVVGTAIASVALGAVITQWDARRLQAPAREVSAALQAQQSALQQLAKQVDSLRPDPRLVADVSTAQATLEQRQAALHLLRAGGLGHPEGHSAALQAFARQSIDGLWLTGLVLDRRDMALRGRAMSPELIPAYVGRLNREPALQGRAFRALDIQRPADEEAAKPASDAARRLAPYVEFALTGSNGSVVAGAEDKK
jgi:hypothetical protein